MKKILVKYLALVLSLFVAAGPAAAQTRSIAAPAAAGSAPVALDLHLAGVSEAPAVGIDAVPSEALSNPVSQAPKADVSAVPADVEAQTGLAAAVSAPEAKRSPLVRLEQAAAQKFSAPALGHLFGEGGLASRVAAVIHPEGELPPSVRHILTDAGFAPVRRRKTGLKLPPGVKPVKPVSSFKGEIAPIERSHFATDHVLEDGTAPVALNIDLKKYDMTKEASAKEAMAAVEKELRRIVDADPAKYGASTDFGAPSADMGRVHVQYAPEVIGAPSIFAVFRQWKEGTQKDGSSYVASVDGGVMRFHIKVFDGKPYVMSYSGGFAAVDSKILTARYTDEEMKRIAMEQLGQRDGGGPRRTRGSRRGRREFRAPKDLRTGEEVPEILFIGRQVTPLGADRQSTKWRVLDIFQGADLAGHAAIVAVDAQTGQAFVINPQDIRFHGPQKNLMGGASWLARRRAPRDIPASPDDAAVPANGPANAEPGAIVGRVLGRGNTLSSGEDHGPIGPMPLAYAYVVDDATGKVVVVTDKDGNFTIPESVSQGRPMTLRVGPQGIYSPVKDADEKDADLTVKMEVSPGQKVVLTLNPSGEDEQLAAVINSYVHVYDLVDWVKAGLKELGMAEARIDDAIVGIIANSTAMALNAFFDPATKTLNLMKRGQIQQRARGRDGQVHVVTITGENTAQPTVIKHEDTHSIVGATSQYDLTEEQRKSAKYQYVSNLVDAVMGSDTNEGTADIGSNLNRDNPEIGNGFLVSVETEDGRKLPLPKPNEIRNAENKIPYKAYDPSDPRSDPHQSGNTLMGTAWMAYQDLIPTLGKEKALKAAFRHFFLACLYIQPASAASALSHLIIEGLRADGSNPFAETIRRHALEDHELDLGTEGPRTS